MNKKSLILKFVFYFLFTFSLGIETKDEFDVSLELNRHQPCSFKEGLYNTIKHFFIYNIF